MDIYSYIEEILFYIAVALFYFSPAAMRASAILIKYERERSGQFFGGRSPISP
jgi:hypothetical protein